MTDTITLIANLALTLSFIIALIFGIEQVRAASRDRRERLTLETLRSFQSREFAELLHYIINSKFPATLEEFQQLPSSEQILFIQYGQEMESLGILVAEKFIDINLVDKTLGSFVSTSWKKYEPLYSDMREKSPDPFLGEYFQWLAEYIDRRMKDNPRKPFFEDHKN